MIESVFSCDAGCGAQTVVESKLLKPPDWITVWGPDHLRVQFDTWDCLRSYLLHRGSHA